MRRTPTRWAALPVVAGLLIAGCGAEVSPPKLGTIDQTGSANGSDGLCRRDVVEWARDQYGDVGRERGELRVATFNIASASSPRFDARVDFTVDPQDRSSPRRIKAALGRGFDELDTEVGEMLAATKAGGPTDLVAMFGGMSEAAGAVHAHDVFVCSDGVDRRIREQMTPEHARQVVEAMDADELPELAGIDVIFDTSSAAGRRELGPTELAAIRVFVTELVEQSGGKLVLYGPGAGT